MLGVRASYRIRVGKFCDSASQIDAGRFISAGILSLNNDQNACICYS